MPKQLYEPKYDLPSLGEAIPKVANRIVGVHEACDSVPSIGALDFDHLVDSIKSKGLLRPIEIDETGQLIDGRSRIQACMIAGLTLSDEDFVVTDGDPWAIAQSNNARRHLTEDQRVMEAARLLKTERAKAAERKAEGARKGRETKSRSLVAGAATSEDPPKKRQPRATEFVSALTGVPRKKLEVAEKVINNHPELASKASAGESTLNEVAERAGVLPAKPSKPKAKPAAKTDKSGKQKAIQNDGPVWQDAHTKIVDRKDAIRSIHCDQVTLYVHRDQPHVGIVMNEGDEWWWHAGNDDDQGTEESRGDAEKKVLAMMAKRDAVPKRNAVNKAE